jgi:hypothetical protein
MTHENVLEADDENFCNRVPVDLQAPNKMADIWGIEIAWVTVMKGCSTQDQGGPKTSISC